MLTHLTIRDFVIVDQLSLDFSAGFGALTGETGAGKSILIDALSLAIGERAEAGMVRSGCERAEIVACFDLARLPEVADWLQSLDLAVEDELVLRRTVDAGGRSRAFLNGSPATAQQLREIGEMLIDIHGQHAHQSLLRPDVQRTLLDAFGGFQGLAREVREAWRAWKQMRDQLEAARAGSMALSAEREQLQWQLEELTPLALGEEGWQALEQEHSRLAHAASLLEGAQFALDLLAEGETAAFRCVDQVSGRIAELAAYDADLHDVSGLLVSVQVELAEVVSTLRRYAGRVELDPARLGELERRMESILSVARKHRVSPGEMSGLRDRWQARLSELGEAGDLDALERRTESLHADYVARAELLRNARLEAATRLATEVSSLMQQLALGTGRLSIMLKPLPEGNANGLESVEYCVSGLAGDEVRPLAKVVSGGELSRISLAIQVVTSRYAAVPTLLFDEVDVGIGGGVAEIVGRMLHELGGGRQVLCVTHLPQVAARADWQWQVSKSTREGKTLSRIELLDRESRIDEIARMLGGVDITTITRQHARELLGLRSLDD